MRWFVRFLAKAFLFTLLPFNGFAEVYKIQMLNSKNKQSMIFDPDFLEIGVGDEVEFLPIDKGHNSQAIFVPQGAEKWQGKNDQKIRIKFIREGNYIFECKNHAIMGMVGAIRVGEVGDQNGDELKKFLLNYQKKLAINKNRIDNLLKKMVVEQGGEINNKALD
ncbi:MAG: pseudoazurin [Proteobacteria bacterium]|nr:pseudoazurin [Pseudomonadota bacterium]NCA28239.1 pseudoazurin [Pseudomonadota bacterium]